MIEVPNYVIMFASIICGIIAAVAGVFYRMMDHRSKITERFSTLSESLMARLGQLETAQQAAERERDLDRRWIELLCDHIRQGNPPPPPARPTIKD